MDCYAGRLDTAMWDVSDKGGLSDHMEGKADRLMLACLFLWACAAKGCGESSERLAIDSIL